MADTPPSVDPKSAADAEAAKKAAEAEAAKKAAADFEASIPTPPKGADFDTVAQLHNRLLAEGSPEIAAAFHKKHVLGYKAK